MIINPAVGPDPLSKYGKAPAGGRRPPLQSSPDIHIYGMSLDIPGYIIQVIYMEEINRWIFISRAGL
jgi:hypothetical protein